MEWFLHRLRKLAAAARNEAYYEIERASGWRPFRAKIIEAHPFCAACGNEDSLECHHKRPYHLWPDLELVASNCMVLCSDGPGGVSCHYLIGHPMGWQCWSPDPDARAAEFRRWLREVKWERE